MVPQILLKIVRLWSQTNGVGKVNEDVGVCPKEGKNWAIISCGF